MNGLAVWGSALRPKTLVASLSPVAVGSAVAAKAGSFSWTVLVLVLLAALGIQAVVNLHNDLADARRGADGPDRLGPPRASQMGWLTPRQIVTGILVALGVVVVCGGLLVWLAGWPLLALGLASILCAFLYTGGPLPLAYVGVADLFVVGFFGVGAVVGTVFAHGATLPAGIWWLGLAVGFAANTLLVVNNLRDRKSDARAGKKTTAVRFGVQFARVQYVFCWVLAYVNTLLALVPSEAWPSLLSMPLAGWLCVKIFRQDGRDLNSLLASSGQLAALFAALVVCGVLL